MEITETFKSFAHFTTKVNNKMALAYLLLEGGHFDSHLVDGA